MNYNAMVKYQQPLADADRFQVFVQLKYEPMNAKGSRQKSAPFLN